MGNPPHCHVAAPWGDGLLVPPQTTIRHLEKVLRLVPGETVSYTDGGGTVGEGVWTGKGIDRGRERRVDRPREVTIAAAPPKGADRQRFVVEKLVELGVTRLIWLSTRHGDVRPPAGGKAEAWATGALEQSRGAWKMSIDGPAGLPELDEGFIMAHPGGPPLRRGDGPVTIAIGPAGGWHPDEMTEHGRTASLAGRILRTETAAVVAAALATRC